MGRLFIGLSVLMPCLAGPPITTNSSNKTACKASGPKDPTDPCSCLECFIYKSVTYTACTTIDNGGEWTSGPLLPVTAVVPLSASRLRDCLYVTAVVPLSVRLASRLSWSSAYFPFPLTAVSPPLCVLGPLAPKSFPPGCMPWLAVSQACLPHPSRDLALSPLSLTPSLPPPPACSAEPWCVVSKACPTPAGTSRDTTPINQPYIMCDTAQKEQSLLTRSPPRPPRPPPPPNLGVCAKPRRSEASMHAV